MSQSYTDYLFANLPAIYRSEGKSGLVYRLLSLFAEVLEECEDKIEALHHCFNPLKADPEFLPWLAAWVALVLDETWSLDKQRRLITQIVELYKLRGTIEGIKTFVEIYTGIRPLILEPFNLGWQVGVRSRLGVDTKVYQPDEDVHCFSVEVKSFEELSSGQKQKIRQIVELQKPAHTKVIHYVWQAGFWQIGLRSSLGINTRVGG